MRRVYCRTVLKKEFGIRLIVGPAQRDAVNSAQCFSCRSPFTCPSCRGCGNPGSHTPRSAWEPSPHSVTLTKKSEGIPRCEPGRIDYVALSTEREKILPLRAFFSNRSPMYIRRPLLCICISYLNMVKCSTNRDTDRLRDSFTSFRKQLRRRDARSHRAHQEAAGGQCR